MSVHQCFGAVALSSVLACQPEPPFASTSSERDAATRAPSTESDASDVNDDAGATTRLFSLDDPTQSSEPPDSARFEVPQGTRSARIEYRATGHGGGATELSCLGPAEEFCRRTHTLTVDGTALGAVEPWRDDCDLGCTLTSYQSDTLSIDSYCAENPCGAIESVLAPRAGWCPGSITPPFVFEDTSLSEPGEHELSLAINRVAEGGSWLLSGIYFAYE